MSYPVLSDDLDLTPYADPHFVVPTCPVCGKPAKGLTFTDNEGTYHHACFKQAFIGGTAV